MTDDQQRAWELLCQFCDLDRSDYYDGMRINAGEAVEAITAALRAAPEGFVMVPVEPTEEMIRAALPHHWPYLGDELREHWRRMLAARPQGVE